MSHARKVVGLMPDTHGVFHDRKAVAAFFRVMEALEPDRIDHLGDLTDCYTTSRYSKDPSRMSATGLRREVKVTASIVARLDELSPEAPHLYMGNHDARPETYLMHNAPAFHELRGLRFRELFELPERWNVHPFGKPIRHGKLWFVHGARGVRSKAGNSALALMDKVGGSVVMGHCHRLARVHRRQAAQSLVGAECGHLAQPNPEYSNEVMDWQQGFAVVSFFKGGDFGLELVPIEKGRAWFRGEWV